MGIFEKSRTRFTDPVHRDLRGGCQATDVPTLIASTTYQMQFWLGTLLAVLLVLSSGALYGLGETTVEPSDEQLVPQADYCVLCTITDQRTFSVDEVVFGPLLTKELKPRFSWVDRSAKPQEKWILYLEQDSAEIRCLTGGARRVKGTRVETNEIREKPRSALHDTTLIRAS